MRQKVEARKKAPPVWLCCPCSPISSTEDKQRAARSEAGSRSVTRAGSTRPNNCHMVRGHEKGIIAVAGGE